MGILISFDPSRHPKVRRPAGATGPATILLFTGVRYERRSDPVEAFGIRAEPGRGPHGKRPTRRRKRA